MTPFLVEWHLATAVEGEDEDGAVLDRPHRALRGGGFDAVLPAGSSRDSQTSKPMQVCMRASHKQMIVHNPLSDVSHLCAIEPKKHPVGIVILSHCSPNGIPRALPLFLPPSSLPPPFPPPLIPFIPYHLSKLSTTYYTYLFRSCLCLSLNVLLQKI